jgi:hypothetical protein
MFTNNNKENKMPKIDKDKLTKAKIYELFQDIIHNQSDNFIHALEELRHENPKEYLQIMLKITERFIPPVTKYDISSNGLPIQPINFILPQMPQEPPKTIDITPSDVQDVEPNDQD